MNRTFYIVGPTAVGKSELAAEVARNCGAEIVSADAFQIYAGFDLLTAKPDASVLRLAPHHLIGTAESSDEMNVERFRVEALAATREIHERGNPVIVVGGSGMYVKALTHGLSPLPPADANLRAGLNQLSEGELFIRLRDLDTETSRTIDARNKRRLVRALEICLLSGRPASEQRARPGQTQEPAGVLLLRGRAELYQRIEERVRTMFIQGVVEEVRVARELGSTAAKALGLEAIRDLIAGRLSEAECVAQIQQATRRYAKRQLTWFQRQTNFEALNLSLHGSTEALELISRKARLSFAAEDV